MKKLLLACFVLLVVSSKTYSQSFANGSLDLPNGTCITWNNYEAMYVYTMLQRYNEGNIFYTYADVDALKDDAEWYKIGFVSGAL